MLTLNDIINVSFRKSSFSGYRPEDVDSFIDQVRDSYDTLIKKSVEQKEKNEALAEENAQLTKKLEILANKIEEYRAEEEEIKSALVSAQKLGDASIREARHKAEIIIKDANLKAERIISGAKDDVIEQRSELERLKKETSDFRARLLDIYKQHLTMINAIPAHKEAPRQAAPEPDPVPAPAPQEIEQEVSRVSEQPEERQDFDITREFSVDAVSFEAEPKEPVPEHDLRYDVLKFGDNYRISEDETDN